MPVHTCDVLSACRLRNRGVLKLLLRCWLACAPVQTRPYYSMCTYGGSGRRLDYIAMAWAPSKVTALKGELNSLRIAVLGVK